MGLGLMNGLSPALNYKDPNARFDPEVAMQMPTPAAPRAPAPAVNGLATSNPYVAPKPKMQNGLLGSTLDAFQRGFDPKGREDRITQGKSDEKEKATKTLALIQQQRQLPEAQRGQWWQQNAPIISEITGVDAASMPMDPAQFTDQALDGHIAALSGQLGISPDKAQYQFLQGPDGAIAVGNQHAGTIEELRAGTPKAKPPIEINGVLVDPETYKPLYTSPGDPNEAARLAETARHNRALEARAGQSGGEQFKSLSPEEVAARGYSKGTVVQVDSRGREYVNARPSSAQTGQPTESERSTGLHAAISINGLQNIMRMEGGGYNRAGVQEQAAGVVGGERERLYDQAADEFIDGYLRAMTGAAATKQEIETYKRQWFPQFGDNESVIQQKSMGRLNALKGMKRKAGRSWDPSWDQMIETLEGGQGGLKGVQGLIDRMQPNGDQGAEPTQPQQDDIHPEIARAIDEAFGADQGDDETPPEGVDPVDWQYMTPEQRALWSQ
jgi:hypothetical protein